MGGATNTMIRRAYRQPTVKRVEIKSSISGLAMACCKSGSSGSR
jgi:hypothetical protein